jgi:hypothetical protein
MTQLGQIDRNLVGSIYGRFSMVFCFVQKFFIGQRIDPYIVQYVFMLSFICVIVCSLFVFSGNESVSFSKNNLLIHVNVLRVSFQ